MSEERRLSPTAGKREEDPKLMHVLTPVSFKWLFLEPHDWQAGCAPRDSARNSRAKPGARDGGNAMAAAPISTLK